MRCHEFEEIADLYLDGELSVETTHAAVVHLDECRDCRDDLAQLRTLNSGISSAVKGAPRYQPDPIFVERLRLSAQDAAHEPAVSPWQWFSPKYAVAAGGFAALIVAGMFAMLAGVFDGPEPLTARQQTAENRTATIPELTPQAPSNQETPQATMIAFREMMHDAVGEHENCTLKDLTVEHAPAGEGAEQPLPAGQELGEIVRASLQQHFPEHVAFVGSHLCESGGRKYTHLLFRRGGSFITVMATRSDGVTGSDDAMFCETAGSYQVACFTLRRRTVFVISDLPEPQNLKLARSVSPAVRRFLEQAKSDL